ncbi:Ribosome production factor 1 [Brachionus plicatilis]|uniref:Ribosome production factor 1 n=1 Tax=Brachionus plicatilis TaxID=10195 RepID=A0A3M7PUY3_BRAPC|nr:Ribosome production factor 1 [Brachionus plicatilis]
MTKNPSEIKNKDVRTKMYLAMKKEKLKAKKKQKLENKDKPKQVPKTLENCRVKDETFINDIQNDQEVLFDLNTDEISRNLKRKSEEKCMSQDEFEKTIQEEEAELDEESGPNNSNDPKILITTNDIKIGYRTYKFCRELSRILPNADYFYKKKVRLSKIIPAAIKRDYSAILVVNENRKQPDGLMISLLPDGPTMNFKLNNLKLSDEIKDGGGFTKHKPEIIMNNFNTRLGLQIGRSFATLFPTDPQYEGRHCITFHNQRDFIFFRHHRYIFRNAKKVGLQELGPKFTLKLRSLQKGTFNSKFGEYEWVQKRHEMESNRRQFSI